MKDLRCCAYSYLTEESMQCDYEILTDEVSSLLGVANNFCEHIKELNQLNYYMYHLNGSIRGKCAITKEDFDVLLELYDTYLEKVGSINYFILPTGTKGGSILHVIRSKIKAVVRIAYKINANEKEVKQIVLDSLNLMSNLVFMMSCYENKMSNHQEIEFVSKSYDFKTNK